MNLIRSLKEKKIYRTFSFYISQAIEKFENEHIWIMASGISFNILICLIPFTLILLTILGIYLDTAEAQQRLMNYLNNVIPLPGDYKVKFISTLIDRTRELSSNTFITGAIGITALFWTISGLFTAMREVLRKIFRIDEELNYFKGKIRDFVLVVISFVLFILSMALSSSIRIAKAYSESILGTEFTVNVFETIVPLVLGLVTSFFLFYVLYSFVPHWKLPKKIVFISATVASVMFEILKFLFAVYILNVANFTRIYGTYATIVISIFLIYYISTVFIIGAVIGQIYRERHLKDPEHSGLKIEIN
jgi:membrane protein